MISWHKSRVSNKNERDWAWVQASIPADLTKINERKKSKKKMRLQLIERSRGKPWSLQVHFRVKLFSRWNKNFPAFVHACARHACVSYAFSVDYRTMLSGEIKVLASRLAGWRKLNYTLLTFPKSPVVSDHSSVSCNYKPGNSFPTSMRTSFQ